MIQHIARDKHIRAVQISNKNKSVQRSLQQCSLKVKVKSLDFFRDSCDALVSTDTPFWAQNNEKLKNFVEVNCDRSNPDIIHPLKKLLFHVLQQYPGND
jgi:hypothetical protein